jgi:hypothetical protein
MHQSFTNNSHLDMYNELPVNFSAQMEGVIQNYAKYLLFQKSLTGGSWFGSDTKKAVDEAASTIIGANFIPTSGGYVYANVAKEISGTEDAAAAQNRLNLSDRINFGSKEQKRNLRNRPAGKTLFTRLVHPQLKRQRPHQ